MATGKITVAAPNRKGAVGRQQEAYNRSLERTAQYSERSDNRATDAAQKAYDRAGQFQFENISRVVQQTDAANEKFLRSRLDQFTEVRNFENQQFQRNEQLALSQRKEQRSTATSIKNNLDRYNQGVRAQNLESLAKISETANSIVETAYKRHIEGITREEFATGVAEGGTFGITPEQLETVSLAQRGLVKAATDEGVANDALFEVDAIQGEDQRRSSPILTGHRAYARARGRAQAARGNWATALDVWINSEAALIPDPENPGQLISPRALARKGPAGTMAALQAGNAFLTEKFGLSGINPAIIAEELSETVTGVTAAIARNIITEDRAVDKQNQIEEVTNRISTSYRGVNFADSFDVTRYFNTQVDMLAPLVGGRGKANDIVVEQLLSVAVANKDVDMLAGLEVADKSLTDPSIGLIGDGRYADLFQQAAERIARQEEIDDRALQEEIGQLVFKIENDHRGDIAEAGADPEAIKTANSTAMQRYLDIYKATGNEKALERFNDLNLKPITHTDQAYSIKLEIFQNTGHIDSDDELQDAVDKGMMTAAQARDLAQRRGVDPGWAIIEPMGSRINSIASSVFIEQIVQRAGLHSIQKLGDFGLRAVETLKDETILRLKDWIATQPPGSVTSASVMTQASRIAREAVTSREYQIKTREGAVSPSEALSGKKPEVIFDGPVDDNLQNRITASPAPNPRSPSNRSFDLRGKRPEVINGFMTANDVVLNDQEIDASIEALKAGAPLPSRVAGISRTTGIPVAEVVSRQDNLNRGGQGLGVDPFVGNPQAAQASAIIPREGAMMIHPNVPQARISRSRQLVEQRRNITMQRAANQRESERLAQLRTAGQDLTDPPVSWTQGQVGARTATNAVKPLLDLLAEGESTSSGGYDAVAGSGTGIPGLSNMTFGQARAQAGNNAIGRYQFIPETMEAALKAAGMSMNDKFSPENQDRLATAWILNGQRKALSAYITGKSDNLSAAVDDAAFEWAALAGMTGAGKYDNDGRNKATISSGRVAQTLQQVRRAYLGGAQNTQPSWVGSQSRLESNRGLLKGVPEQCANALRQSGFNPPVAGKPWDGLDSGPALANSFFTDAVGKKVSATQLKPGDYVAYERTYGSWGPGVITHVAVYAGNGMIWDHSKSNGLSLRSIRSPGGKVLYGSRPHNQGN